MATETKDGCGQFKRFSGADLDGKAYRQWKLWHLEENPSGEIFSEQETVEILAASWKDKRAEISFLEELQIQPGEHRQKKFVVKVGDVRKQTRCFKCQKVGH